MGRLTPARQALEAKWHRRVLDAKGDLDFARANVVKIRRDFPPGEIPSADGNFMLSQAIAAENAALKEYENMLRVYTEVVLHGTVPGGSSNSKSR